MDENLIMWINIVVIRMVDDNLRVDWMFKKFFIDFEKFYGYWM